MLKTIDPLLDAELLYVLAAMGHGDDLVLVDLNFPAASVAAKTVFGKLIRKDGVSVTEAARAILTLLPVDDFVDVPVHRMEVRGEPHKVLPVHEEMKTIVEQAEDRPITLGSLERHAFYEVAKKACAVVATSEDRPYGCFIIKKGVVF